MKQQSVDMGLQARWYETTFPKYVHDHLLLSPQPLDMSEGRRPHQGWFWMFVVQLPFVGHISPDTGTDLVDFVAELKTE